MKILVSILSILFLSLNILAQEKEENDSIPQKVIEPVDLISIPEQSAIDIQKVRLEYAPVIAKPMISEIQPEADSIRSDVRQLSVLSDELLEEKNPFQYFNSFSTRWERISRRLVPVSDKLTSHAEDLEDIKISMEDDLEKWDLSLEALKDDELSGEVEGQVDLTVFKIDSVFNILNDSLKAVLNLQNELSVLKLKIDEWGSIYQ
jgi:hypothetical protein